MHCIKRISLIAVALTATALLAACQADEPVGVLTPARVAADPLLQGNAGKPPRIAFASGEEGSQSIHTMNPDGTDRRAITRDDNDATPTWSPDRRYLAFARPSGTDGPMYTMNTKGARITLVATGSNPAWSPDGMLIAYDRLLSGNRDISVKRAEGLGTTRLTTDPADDEDATWSPDGKRIAFISTRTGTREIFVMNADGSSQTQVTTCGAQGRSCSSPAWSPIAGDERIAFAVTGAVTGLFTIRADGTGLTAISTFGNGLALEPAWSPDGSQLAFTRYAAGAAADIYRINIDGTGLTQLTSTTAADLSPAWVR